MANEYHDAAGRFCSKSDMQKAIAGLAASGDIAAARELSNHYQEIEEAKQRTRFVKDEAPRIDEKSRLQAASSAISAAAVRAGRSGLSFDAYSNPEDFAVVEESLSKFDDAALYAVIKQLLQQEAALKESRPDEAGQGKSLAALQKQAQAEETLAGVSASVKSVDTYLLYRESLARVGVGTTTPKVVPLSTLRVEDVRVDPKGRVSNLWVRVPRSKGGFDFHRIKEVASSSGSQVLVDDDGREYAASHRYASRTLAKTDFTVLVDGPRWGERKFTSSDPRGFLATVDSGD